jgi:hypothetical protein
VNYILHQQNVDEELENLPPNVTILHVTETPSSSLTSVNLITMTLSNQERALTLIVNAYQIRLFHSSLNKHSDSKEL